MTVRTLPLIVAAAVGLSGCISLFPKAKPLNTYKLTAAVPAPSANAATGAVVLRSPTVFTTAASGDRILTVTGAEAATIAGARWVAPASQMFDEALSAAFASTSTRLTIRGDVTPADQVLRVEVRTFETRYAGGEGAAPTVVIEARASLTDLRNRTASASREFRAEQVASENRVGPIVDAYNAATTQIVTEIARWTESQAPTRQVG
jgi:cholesterol transport system auxiliary component